MVVLASARGVQAGDWYVNPASGNDSNDGSSPSSAWRTIAHAGLTAPPGASETIHLARALYFESGILFRGQRLLGDTGSDSTVIDGGGASDSILKSFKNTVGTTPSTFASIRGVTLRNASTGISISTELGDITTLIEDVVIDHVIYGIFGGALAQTGTSQSSDLFLTVRNARISDCNQAVWLWDRQVSSVYAEISDSTFQGASTHGVVLDCWPGGTLNAAFQRCRIQGSVQRGVFVTSSLGGSVLATFQGCAITGNQVGFAGFDTTGGGGVREARFQDCTIAGNATNSATGVGASSFRLRGTLVHGNGTDAIQGTVVESVANWIGGADPQFVDAAGGDYRLRLTSPCVDTGDPASPPGSLDLLKRPRPIDGDLDIQERPDIGAFEFAPLDIQTLGVVGTSARTEISAPSAGTAFVYFSRMAAVPPTVTPYGEWDLGPASSLVFTRQLLADVPFVTTRPVPPGAGMPGQTLSLQALLPSSAAPLGQAWSNAAEITLQP
ncbi:MAG: right-handed parallel beta-helix repeat-containing protein [Planctomycetota bacterium]|nr:right-handed parallel beta-helix repeat-containing protein [Planctomycetota bacterium]